MIDKGEYTLKLDLFGKTFDEAVKEVGIKLADASLEIIEWLEPVLGAIYEDEYGHPFGEEPESAPLPLEGVEVELADFSKIGVTVDQALAGLFAFDNYDPIGEFETRGGGPETAEVTAWEPEPLPVMNLEDAVVITQLINDQDMEVFTKANREYAQVNDVFANFRRQSDNLGLSPEQVLLVFAQKHWDGIVAYVRKGVPQRETLDSRLADMRVYLRILDLMNVARN
jgi:hypothetical protein